MTDRIRTVRASIAAETAKLPPHSADGHHDGGLARHYRPEANVTNLTAVDTTVKAYDAGDGRGDAPTEAVRTGQADPDDTPAAWEPPKPRNPKPDPTQGARGAGSVDSAQLAASEGRTADALRLTTDQLRRAHLGNAA